MLRKPGEPVHKYQCADKQQKNSAENLDRVQMPAEFLVKLQKPPNTDRSDQKWNCESRRIAGQQQHTLANSVLGRGDGQHARPDSADTARPAERKGKAEKETAYDSGLAASTDIAQMDVTIQPAGHRRPQQENERGSIELDRLQDQVRAAAQRQSESYGDKQDSHDQPGANGNLHQPADQVQPEQDDQGSCNRGQQKLVLQQERADRARRCAKGDEHRRKSQDKGER